MSSETGRGTDTIPTLRRLRAATAVAVIAFSFTHSARAEDLSTDVADQIGQMMDKTFLFRNDSDRIPQLEYFRPDGTGVVWSAALGDKVVPVAWTASNGKDGKGAFCLIFKGADIGTAQDLRMCDGLDSVKGGIRDARDGDPYGLAEATRMAIQLPQDVGSLDDVDRALGRD